MIAVLLFCVITVTVFYYITRYILVVREMHKLPGPPSKNFLIGNIGPLLNAQEDQFTVVRQWSRDYYPIYKMWAAHEVVANICNPHDCEIVLSSTVHNTKSVMYCILHSWLNAGLLTSGGSKWQKRRKLLTPAFHFNILQEFIKIFRAETKKLVEDLRQESHKPSIEITGYISGFTLNTIAETSMGITLDRKSPKNLKYVETIRQVGEIYVYRLVRPWLYLKSLYFLHCNYYKEIRLVKILHQFTRQVIAKREKAFQSPRPEKEEHDYSRRKRLAMLDLLLTAKEEGFPIDDEGIREEVDTFMFEGHDTTSSAISFILMLVACNPKIQDRIVEEMESVLSSSATLDYQTLQELKYMECCIKEALRLYPSVPLIGRILGEDIVTYSGHLLKAGTFVNLHIFDIHRNPDLFPDPEKFDPDRFLPENSKTRHNFAYLPFSAGPRNCIGQKFAMLELKTALCGVLSEFVLEPVDNPESISFKFDMILRSKTGIRVKFVKRKNEILRKNFQLTFV